MLPLERKPRGRFRTRKLTRPVNGFWIMIKTFKAGSIPITVEYKKIKTLRITVYPPDGEVRVSAPLGTPGEAIKKFVFSKILWIERQREKFRRGPKVNSLMQNNEIHFVWGKAYNLELVEKKGRPKIELTEKSMSLYMPPGASKEEKRRVLDKWYHRKLKETAPAVVRKWESVTGISIKKIYYRKMKSHWGSCNYQRQTIRLNTELVKKPPECLAYVIVHEILHVIEPSHNRAFYRLMDAYMPTWKTIRKKMNAGEI
jgi:predicted metal-dependent hydrolase